MGAKRHMLTNAGGMAAHHGSNLADVLAHKGFQAGQVGSDLSWAARKAMQLGMGAESTMQYDAARKAGKAVMEMKPALRSVQRTGQRTNSTQNPTQGTGRRVMNEAAVGIPAAAVVALDPVGVGFHAAINKGRQMLGSSRAGKDYVQAQLVKGLKGHKPGKAEEIAKGLLLSPSVTAPQHIGHAAQTSMKDKPRIAMQSAIGALEGSPEGRAQIKNLTENPGQMTQKALEALKGAVAA